MKSRIVCVALLAIAASLSAQAPAAPTAAPTAAPKVKGASKAEFRVGGFMVQGERNYDFYNNVSSDPGSIKGVEILLRGSGIGIYIRSLSGDFGDAQPQVISADARVLLFPPVFTVFAGVGKRGRSGIKDVVWDFAMFGVSSTVNIGGSGLRTYVSGGMMAGKDKEDANSELSTGMEAEAAIFYRLPRVPIFVTLGYRTETFNGKTKVLGPPPYTIESPEEVRGLRLGAGIQFGGH